MSTSTGARATSAAVDEADAINMIPFLTEDLMAYADGRPVDEKPRAALDDLILDYIDDGLDSEVAHDIEALMRAFPNVARLVAGRSEETHLQNQLSLFFDGELDPKASTDIRRLIEDDSCVAELARQIRQGGDYLRVVLQPIPGQHLNPIDVKVTRDELLGASDEAVPIVRFNTLIAYATGMAIDKKARVLLDGMIIRYIDGTLDRLSTFGLEASMRLSSSVAKLVADKSSGQPNSSGLKPTFRHQIEQKRTAVSV